MPSTYVPQMEHNIARCRVVLSLAAFVVVYIDPEEPLIARWIHFTYGPFVMDLRLLVVMGLYAAYSLLLYWALQTGWLLSQRAAARTVWADVLFGVAIGAMTEGVTGPSYPLFAFAVVTGGLRGGLREAMLVTAVNIALYLALLVPSGNWSANVYIMRPVYLAITGYVVGYLGQQRLDLQEQMRQLEVAEQRHRIARDLHDGYAQALAGINLRLEGSRRLLRANSVETALSHLTDLQESVDREYDDLRRYARSLAGVEVTATAGDDSERTQMSLNASVSGSIPLVDQVLSIAREGIHNIRRHARARTAKIDIRSDNVEVHISIDDDGVGFDRNVTPWSIASRVNEIGGEVQIEAGEQPGAHLLITLPRA